MRISKILTMAKMSLEVAEIVHLPYSRAIGMITNNRRETRNHTNSKLHNNAFKTTYSY